MIYEPWIPLTNWLQASFKLFDFGGQTPNWDILVGAFTSTSHGEHYDSTEMLLNAVQDSIVAVCRIHAKNILLSFHGFVSIRTRIPLQLIGANPQYRFLEFSRWELLYVPLGAGEDVRLIRHG